jgi:hypothetical protein
MRSGVVALGAAGIVVFALLTPQSAVAELATAEEASQVCQNWLSYVVFHDGTWAGSAEPRVAEVRELLAGDMLLAHVYTISPSGSVVVPVLKELPPVKASSQDWPVEVDQTEGIAQLLRDILEDRFRLFIETYGSLDAVQPAEGRVLLDPINRSEWERYLLSSAEFAKQLGEGRSTRAQVGPMLTSSWHQGSPYNIACPMGDGGRTVVGCVATAMTQIMKYWEWPPSGIGSHSYYWWGDDSCGGSTSGQQLSADFSDSYDWANMPNNCDSGCDSAEQSALAELSYEAGVSVEMDYGACGSGAYMDDCMNAMENHFRYTPGMQERFRSSYSATSWFNLIVDEIDAGRPMLYGIHRHAIVCDGWRDTGGLNQYHMNYGWGGSYNGWYTVDNLHCDWEGCNPMVESLIRYIEPLGEPNDNCEEATPVENGTYSGSTADTNNDGSASCGNSSSSPDVWYVFMATANGTLDIDTCGSSFNTVLSIHSYCPGTTSNELACNDDSCGQQSAISLAVTVGNPYIIRVSGSNGASGDFVLNVDGPVDTYPPEPNPTTWAGEPWAVTTTDIAMSVTPSSDAGSPPVEYYFEFVEIQMPGGHDSGWQSSNFYVDGGLFTNRVYGYTARVRDSADNETEPAPLRTAATFIETPESAPVVMTYDTTAVLMTTESFTNLTYGQSGLYFDCISSGGDGGINEWIQETSDTATGLTPDTEYTFRFKARNQDAVETDWSPEATWRTKAAVPSAPVLSNPSCYTMDVAIGSDINPSHTTYAIRCSGSSPWDANWDGMHVDASGNPSVDPVYQTKADWGITTIQGLHDTMTYTFEVTARNLSGIVTDPGPEASLMTDNCSEPTCDDGVQNQGEDRIDCGGPCPPCDCLSDAECDNAQYCDGTEVCDAYGHCQAGPDVDCNDGVSCTADSCNESTDSCDNIPNDAYCDNGLFCDGEETCHAALDCQGGSDPCPGQLCDEDLDACVACITDGDCDDEVFCNGAEWCDALGECQLGADPCPGQYCRESDDACVDCLNDAHCDDGNPCNGVETCDEPSGTCVPGSCDAEIDLINENFDVDEDGFAYQDDTFGTSNPSYATGSYESSGGYTGGGLRVYLGPGDIVNPASGGWVSSFDLEQDATITVSLHFRMLMGEGYETNEYGEVVMEIDDARYGNDTNDSLVHMFGDGNGGGIDDTGWLYDQLDIPLLAGSHVIEIGAYNNDATYGDEFVEVFLDDVWITTVLTDQCECDDDLFCNGEESCVGGECVSGPDPCPGQLCRESDDTCVDCLIDDDCNDLLYCNGIETCDAGGYCQDGPDVDCNDGVDCTMDTCNEDIDSCDNIPDDAYCDNSLFCDGAEWCDALLDCQAGEDPCGPDETCNEEQDVCEAQHYCATLPTVSVCMGDVNCDGVVNPIDAGLVKYWYGDTDPDSLCYYDVDCDGQIDPIDVGLVKFYYGPCTAESGDPCWMAP